MFHFKVVFYSLPKGSTISRKHCIADDVALYATELHRLQRLLDVATNWAVENAMTWSNTKCKLLLQDPTQESVLRLSGEVLDVVDHTSY